ncbi:MAG TPA: dienelactone hydrolase family protein [Caldimonas sp.]|nr:dienelactone hydrolase family protein [Caldimonas sp.]HEX2540046.1 dienelactone hydrolase family protein [Caldimonas sp.]
MRSLLARSLAAACIVAGAALLPTPGAAQERVSFPSLDGAGHAPVVLTGFFFAAAGAGATRAPTVALFHGCGGAYDRQGALGQRLRDYAALFNGRGMHALVVDSLTPRHEKELCTQRTGSRRVTVGHRRQDALGAVAYLAERQDVDAARIGLVGWSHGGSTVLAATNRRHRDVDSARVQPSFAIAFYPGCETELKRGYEPVAPLLLLAGELDDWTPAAPCAALARASAEPKPEIEIYAGAWHGFDSAAPVRLRRDVPNGVRPGQGVHVGGNPAARLASRERLLRFVAAH